ncbi:HK97 gp10 family phage protein [Delftia acidovorans]|uniref:HK97 gp10 family phage protein n=1 Tax=Delftia acidovorans TaxID=80866 RepID=UPI002FDDE2ED
MGFAADLRALCERAGDKAEMVVRGAALELGGQILDRSPVDSGRFKNNWVTATGSADTSRSADPDVSGARSKAMLNEKIASWKPGQTIWILNNLPYAKRLEYGWSQQAPGGMVRLAVQNYSQAIKKAADQVRRT